MGAGFLGELAKKSKQRGKAMQQLGMKTPETQAAVPPMNPSGPGEPTPSQPAVAVPPSQQQPQPGAEPTSGQPAGAPLGPIPTEMQAALNRIMQSSQPTMLSEELRRVAAPGADQRHQFFNLFGHMPTSRELGSFSLRLNLERQLQRPPTVQEVKQALAGADFVDRTPEPFAQ